MMTSSAKLTNEQSLHLEFINRFRCEAQHEHAQDWNITQQGRWTGAQHRLCLLSPWRTFAVPWRKILYMGTARETPVCSLNRNSGLTTR